MPFLPYVNENVELKDGCLFHLLPYCKRNFNKSECQQHYGALSKSNSGCYQCPHGLSSYVFSSPTGRMIFTGLRVKGNYDKKKNSTIASEDVIYNPVIDEEQCYSIVKETAISIIESKQLTNKLNAIGELLHEAKSLNAQIKGSIDGFFDSYVDDSIVDGDEALRVLRNVHVSSYMISNRFTYFDSILNPSLPKGQAYSAIIFKKFDKMRKLLKGYLNKNVWISVNAPKQCDYRYNVFPTFEILLFTLLENAIKYSPEGNPVTVNFYEQGSVLKVSITSMGPYCDENEIVHLCEKGFRGENAQLTTQNGQGYGLSFAKTISDEHGIKMTFNSQYQSKDHGIKYGLFAVELVFDADEKGRMFE